MFIHESLLWIAFALIIFLLVNKYTVSRFDFFIPLLGIAVFLIGVAFRVGILIGG